MFTRIDKYIKDNVKDLLFVELKEDQKFGDAMLKKGVPLPILAKDIVTNVKGKKEEFDVNSFVEGMIRILALDSEFKHNDVYKEFLIKYDKDIVTKIVKNGVVSANKEDLLNAFLLFKSGFFLDGENYDAGFNYARILENTAVNFEDTSSRYLDYIDEATEVYEYLNMNFDENPLTLFHLGFIYTNNKEYRKAEKVWKLAIESDLPQDMIDEVLENLAKNKDKLNYEIGYNMILNGRVSEGLEKLIPLEDNYNDWWNLLFFIGLGYRFLEEYDNAINYFNKSNQYNNNNDNTLNELGICYMMIGDFEEAEKNLIKGSRINPNNHEVLCNLGVLYMEKGDNDKAREYLELSLEIEPTDELTINCLRILDSKSN